MCKYYNIIYIKCVEIGYKSVLTVSRIKKKKLFLEQKPHCFSFLRRQQLTLFQFAGLYDLLSLRSFITGIW